MKEQELKKCFPEVPGEFSDRLDATLYSLPNRGRQTGKRILFRRVVPVLVAMLVLSTAAFAVGLGKVHSQISRGSNTPHFTRIPTDDEISNLIGYLPKIPAELPGGYKYLQTNLNEDISYDENKNVIWEGRHISITYQGENEDLDFSAMDANAPNSPTGTIIENYNDSDIYYFAWLSKLVPSNYEMTEQDKADEANGKYIFATGGLLDVYVDDIKSVLWEQDGVRYLILATNSAETQESLLAMAKAVIDAE